MLTRPGRRRRGLRGVCGQSHAGAACGRPGEVVDSLRPRPAVRRPSAMRIAILDDYQNAVPTLACFSKLADHQVKVWNDHTKEVGKLASRLKDADALVLIRERTPIPAALVAKLPRL